MKADISNFEDIVLFVDGFYSKVNQDELIGPIFDAVITDWNSHLAKMYDFWNAVLFGVAGFKGNPFARHAPLPLQKNHFERWLLLFEQTIDEHFSGELADETKKKAGMMAEMFLSKLSHMKGGSDRVIV
ncbi:group III truncated hemoglobin [Pedobacter panaciterrae]|uniref:group III truncated hemoglobin n=1 Tax=Pedobacter panaciterrae TaxID=363849 RepID=UPI00155D88B3|nr:group III truncated hemoglobin [Pedobacter panaciterrae]NQX56445.1 group III truncated hemoglobin [Pedobacter panaciterrae]